ncbi:TRAP transporter substrate-binding protein [Alkalihalobacillus oceani]|uniref:TRAP transporter substrate-binding protein n=1 Tax=Halalkalibacter oceani TaxID=1653776 RepID=A0A9X2DMZ4_9BACI|nr:TRAP transporter substrate-binding protein [Halalkalibacter oceani]MCM3712990.1 TRAP transporter substrate-binding protein [Halalkalibacter oceani]
MKKGLITVVALLMITIVAACGGESGSTDNQSDSGNNGGGSGDSEQTFKFTSGHTTSVENQQHVGLVALAELLEEKSGGSITMDVFENSQLGSEPVMLQAVQDGSQHIVATSSTSVSNFIPEWGIFDIPFLFESTEQADEIVRGEVGDRLFETLPEHGYKGLAWLSSIERNIYGTKKIESVDDFKTATLRSIEAPGFVETFTTLGAQVVTMPGSELYTALQQGVVEGGDNSPELFLGLGHDEVSDYYNLTKIHYLPIAIIMSLDTWEALTPEQQDMVMAAAQEAAETGSAAYAQSYEESFIEMEELGVEVVNTDLTGIVEATKHLKEEMANNIPSGMELLELIESNK